MLTMSQSQRQKKRSAQFRKKHFDSKGRGQGEKSKEERQRQPVAAPGHQRTAQPQTEERETPTKGKQDSQQSVEESDKGPVHSKYSRRKVASNWDRYAEIDRADSAVYTPETEEQLQMRLVQLLRLPQPLQDTQWTPHTAEEGEEGGGGSALSLDVMQLAESLRTLPTHTRLALPSELLQHYGVSENDLVFSEANDASPSVSRGEPSAGEHSSTTCTAAASINLTCLLPKSDYTFNFSAPSKQGPPSMPLLQANRNNSTTDNDQGLDSLLQTSSHSHKAPPHTGTHLPGPHSPKAPPPTSTHLPSAHSHEAPPHTVTHLPTLTCTPQSHPSHQSNTSGTCTAIHSPLNTATEQTLPTTAELDDMLDDLLA